MGLILIIHLIALGIWIGVVGAEFAIEFDGMKDDNRMLEHPSCTTLQTFGSKFRHSQRFW